ncbi:MAG: hypothetical protein M5U26_03570 [Planctomycetota bacterium]|nr:hypothetical protein [Planctomycetota bacterium]
MRWNYMKAGSELLAFADDQGIPLGTVAVDELGRVWKWLKNAGAASIAAQKAAKLTSYTGYTVTLNTTLNQPFAGVRAVGADTLPQNYYGWFIVRGIATFTFGDSALAITAGKRVVLDDDADGGNVGQQVVDITSTVNETNVELVTDSMQGAFGRALESQSVTDGDVDVAILENVWGD